MKLSASLFLLALPLLGIACADEAADPQDVNVENVTTTRTSVILDETDNGATVPVKAGQSVIVELPANPSTGYSWQVVATDRTFGYPEESFLAESNAIGAGGTAKLTWKTSGPLSMLGQHTVKLEYRGPGGGPAVKTFTFTANVAPATPANASVRLTEANDGATISLAAGKDVVVELQSNASTGYSWDVVATDRTFGYPASEDFIAPESDAIGAPGRQRFVWRTGGGLPMTGTHQVRMEYRRAWAPNEPAAQSFSFTVKIQ